MNSIVGIANIEKVIPRLTNKPKLWCWHHSVTCCCMRLHYAVFVLRPAEPSKRDHSYTAHFIKLFGHPSPVPHNIVARLIQKIGLDLWPKCENLAIDFQPVSISSNDTLHFVYLN